MAARTVLLDTSFIVALENRSDPHHNRAKALDRELLDEGSTSVLHWGIVLEIGDGYSRVSRRAKGTSEQVRHYERNVLVLSFPSSAWERTPSKLRFVVDVICLELGSGASRTAFPSGAWERDTREARSKPIPLTWPLPEGEESLA